jgi:DnaK suppressor protein
MPGAADGVIVESVVEGPEQPDGSSGRQAPEASVDAVDELLDEVESALDRLDDGTYGQCTSCGALIDDARLTEDPTTSECASCLSGNDG